MICGGFVAMTLLNLLWLAASAPQRQPRGRIPPTCRRLPTAINLLLEELKLLEHLAIVRRGNKTLTFSLG